MQARHCSPAFPHCSSVVPTTHSPDEVQQPLQVAAQVDCGGIGPQPEATSTPSHNQNPRAFMVLSLTP